eukprot:9855916-Prorocentrum_lima.AAC.1
MCIRDRHYNNPRQVWETLELEETLLCRRDRSYPLLGRMWWPGDVREIVLDERAGREMRKR